jgi:YVTN family beta-propeller protein
MRTRAALVALLLVGQGCATPRRGAPPLAPLGGAEGEIHVFALPLTREAERLEFTVEAVSARRRDGTEVPLEVVQRDVVGAEPARQRLLAWGRVPPGDYAGLVVKVGSATLASGAERARLVVEPDSGRMDLSFSVASGSAVVVWAALNAPGSIGGEYVFSPDLKATLAPQTPPQVTLYCTNASSASVSAVDRHARLVTGMIPVGAAPLGIVLDRAANRGYVALSREDRIEILDAAANASAGRIRLTPGDGPAELALTPDGTLVVVNVRSRTVSLLDPQAMTELGRVPVGDAPAGLRVDRSGQRAYVANRGSGTVTVIDVPNRAVAGTIATDTEPLWVDLSRDGTRLFVVHRGSAYLGVFALPSLAPQAHAYVGLGATTVRIDPRTDLIYLSRGDERRISVYDPLSFQPLDQIDVPGAVTRMVIDDVENTLLALMPERQAIAVLDLTSRKLLAEIPVGRDPYGLAFIGERL